MTLSQPDDRPGATTNASRSKTEAWLNSCGLVSPSEVHSEQAHDTDVVDHELEHDDLEHWEEKRAWHHGKDGCE